MTANTNLHTNIAFVDVPNAPVEVGRFETYDVKLHRELEASYIRTHVFRRWGNALEVVRLDPSAELVGESFETRSVRHLGGLLPALIEEGIGRFLLDSKSKLRFRRRRPLDFMSLEPKNDLVQGLIVRRGDRIHVPVRVLRGYRLEARRITTQRGLRTGLVIDARANGCIEATCAELAERGIELAGLYAQERTPSASMFLDEERQTIGVISQVEGGRVILGCDRRVDAESHDAHHLFLDPSPPAIRRLLAFFVDEDAHEALWGVRGEISSGPRRLERIERLRARLSQQPIEIAPGIALEVGKWLDASVLPTTTIRMPVFVVGPGSGREVDATTGVFRHGPRQVPMRKQNDVIRACIICQSERQRETECFVEHLVDGHNEHGGMHLPWRLPDVRRTVFAAKSVAAEDYEKAARRALDAANDWDLAFVQIPDGTKEAMGCANPYLVTKSKFLAQNIPVQEFRSGTVENLENRRWALGSLALQVFSKLGGVPWLLKASRTDAHEVVVGLGSAQLGLGRFGQRERVVGLATAFSGDGTYWLTEASRAVAYEELEDALGEIAEVTIERISQEMNWRPGDRVRVVIHSFKNFRGTHTQRIQRTLDALRDRRFDVEVAFVHIAEHHPFLFFDQKQRQRIPPRGRMVQLGRGHALISLLGVKEVRRSQSGFPRPLSIRLHRESTFEDLQYLAEQVLAFAAHSWRNFPPTSLPVTILYPELIAKLLGRLGGLPRWDPDVLRGSVGTSRWFL